ncbi:hypothetical protein Curi_c08700 [Gottschalkia acidurici 9a]|uniref:Putative zinc-finger domain-containing protein n=1 Tax=Gottschalkia acidurici (strain ATCC 7906 / DSM 604 / BCRC 14475 / CIP 104303 / KCTC 5404 / NCIMB 10678 / 9a) TaxID=1128398 RepID=K0AZ28_GOTA9|nr:zf-HC2 domain-containing protein [Gottschalkia acidurici]AFS77940.1 hypothetical protein Curi_c08700 [Gottschalkia acidurici 9a]
MKCEEAMDKMDRYIEQSLTDIEAFNIKKHISNCVRCKKEYDDMEKMFFILSNHNTVITPIDFTSGVISKVKVYEGKKSIKETFIFKWVTSIIAAGAVAAVFNITQYKPVNLFSEIYKSSIGINKMILSPIDKISESMKEIAGIF